MSAVGVSVCGGVLVGLIALWLAYRLGRLAAQAQVLKQALRKQQAEKKYVQQISHRVYALNGDDARRRLHEIASKQR